MDTAKTIETPYNNAVSVINTMNNLLVENNIKDSKGESTAQLDMTPANPAWLFALACGQLHTSWQQQISKAYSCLDPQNCDDDQVLVLASLAGVERDDGTPSHISVQLFNQGEDEITVPYGTSFSESISNHSWYLNKTVVLGGAQSENRYAVVILYAEERGAFDVPTGTSFTCDDQNISGIVAESVAQSYQGESIETIASLRNRISTGKETVDFLAKAARAIEELGGIESCSIWFNQSATTPLMVGDVEIPPREAYIAIKGVDINNGIAAAFFNYLDVPATVGEHHSSYIRGQQELNVAYDVAQEVAVQIFVSIRKADAAQGAAEALIEQLTKWSGTLACGENLTAQQVSEWLSSFANAKVIGCNVNTADGLITDICPAQYCVWDRNTIIIAEV